MKHIAFLALMISAGTSWASDSADLLIQLKDQPQLSGHVLRQLLPSGSRIEDLQFQSWVRAQVPNADAQNLMVQLVYDDRIVAVQPNYKIRLLDRPQMASWRKDFRTFNQDCPFPFPVPGLCDEDGGGDGGGFPAPGEPSPSPTPPGGGNNAGDNPALPPVPSTGSGADPLFSKQWGMKDIGTEAAWRRSRGTSDIIVAVIDTGVDYTHEDLLPNLWRNPKEIPGNGIDDDGNGFVDDVIGWDFVANDNLPYDLKGNIFNGGNPGHGTHCAGNVAARGENGRGISGVAPNAKIMVLRFLSSEGGGTTADAVKSIKYAVDNGARITSNSWGSEGEDPADVVGNKALRDIIQYAQDKGTLFIAAAGNGHQGKGYNNDTDSKPAYPASYDHESIISVAALDSSDKLGSFSNWGKKAVDIGAPGVKVYSTVVGGSYTDSVMPILGITWDGTSMATPHVAGAAALYWSANPTKTWLEVKNAIMKSAKKIPSLNGKAVSDGKLNVDGLMAQ